MCEICSKLTIKKTEQRLGSSEENKAFDSIFFFKIPVNCKHLRWFNEPFLFEIDII